MSLGIQRDDTLQSWLATCARTISARALVTVGLAGGLLISLAWALQSGVTWALLSVGTTGIAFSVWAYTEQRLGAMSVYTTHWRARAARLSVRLMHRVAAIIGVLSGAALLMSLPVVLLGNWIS